MPIISIPKPLREKLGDEASDSLVQMINQFEYEHRNSVISLTEEKFENKLNQELSSFREAMIRSDLSIKEELKKDILSLREEMIRSDLLIKGELKEEISNLRGDMNKNNTATIKWMFIFWIGQIGALLGILFAVFK